MYCDYSLLNKVDDLFVLIVDACEENSKRLESNLLEYGVHVAKAKSIDEARNLVNQFSYDLIFMDVQLSDNSPCNLAHEAHLAHQEVPYVIAWSNVKQDCAGLFKQLGFDDYVYKPDSYEHLHCLLCQFYQKWQSGKIQNVAS